MDLCPATNTEEKKCEFGYDGKCEFECQAFSGHPKNCFYEQGADEFGNSLCEKIFRTLDDGTSEETMSCPLTEDSKNDEACCDVDPWGDFDKEPMMQHSCIRYTHEYYENFIYGGLGIQQWKCIELIDPNEDPDEGFGPTSFEIEEEARENEKKITYNAEEAKDLKGSDYGRSQHFFQLFFLKKKMKILTKKLKNYDCRDYFFNFLVKIFIFFQFIFSKKKTNP